LAVVAFELESGANWCIDPRLTALQRARFGCLKYRFAFCGRDFRALRNRDVAFDRRIAEESHLSDGKLLRFASHAENRHHKVERLALRRVDESRQVGEVDLLVDRSDLAANRFAQRSRDAANVDISQRRTTGGQKVIDVESGFILWLLCTVLPDHGTLVRVKDKIDLFEKRVVNSVGFVLGIDGAG